jgi:hypothetical protein
MYILGQFRVIGAPERFVWMRGHADMTSRQAGLESFYNGPFWQKHRERTNAMIADSSHAHLLHWISDSEALTCGRTPDTIATELADGVISIDTGVVGVDFYQASPALTERAAEQLTKAYSSAGIQVRGVFATELTANNFPRHPAIQNPGEVVIITAYESETNYRQRGAPTVDTTIQLKAPDSLLLAPTLRSPLQW